MENIIIITKENNEKNLVFIIYKNTSSLISVTVITPSPDHNFY